MSLARITPIGTDEKRFLKAGPYLFLGITLLMLIPLSVSIAEYNSSSDVAETRFQTVWGTNIAFLIIDLLAIILAVLLVANTHSPGMWDALNKGVPSYFDKRPRFQ